MKYQEDAVVDCVEVLIIGDLNRKYSSCHSSNRQYILCYLHTLTKKMDSINLSVYQDPDVFDYTVGV